MCFFIMEARDWCGLIFMNLPFIIALLATAALSSSTVIKSPETGAIPPNFELLILHNNDMHARFEQTSQLSGVCTTADREAGKCYGGFPRVATVVKEARRKAASGEGPPVLYLNAGDTYTGTAWFTIYKWKIAAEFINALRPDAVSLGNHEFDNGVKGLTPFIENLTCPVLTANIDLTNVPELATETNLKKSMIIDIDGVQIGIVGYLTPDTKFLAVPNNVDYIDEIVAIKEEVKKLQEKKIRIIIALGHSGYVKDLQIAKEVEGVDLVIGGHTNTFLWNGTTPDSEEPQGPYPTYVKQASGRSVPVVQAYAYTKYFGKLLMTFDSKGEAIKISGQPILLDNSIPQDPEVIRIIERYRDDVLNVADEVIGNTSVVLSGEHCKYLECNLGNLITDAMVYRYATLYKGEHWTDAPIAIIQGGGIRASISYMHMPANITKGDLLIVMPFEGNLVTVSMAGSVIFQMLEHSVYDLNNLQDHGEFLQFSGLRVVYDYKRPPKSRVVEVRARCGDCQIPQYKNINKTQIYKVIMPQFVANGGDGYSMLVGLPQETLDYNELQCTEYYLRHRSPVFPQVEGRLVLLNEEAMYHKDSSSSISVSLCLMISLIISVMIPSYSYF
ncbi:protein 5NUC-like isoform X2 [Leguminivora glycinivorella]|uniref:protein 5NUC-like isoform X2 n=1 Tax=Leguminivora glycinivorella TaxID=1035111 RepID=UPI00200DD1A8|nr:protein 5NUC-like isoform X2 [Leguminivora glycinivorella]